MPETMSLVVVEHEYDEASQVLLNELSPHEVFLRQPQQKQQDVWVVESQAQDVGQESVMAFLLEPDPHVVVSMSFLAGLGPLCEHEVKILGLLYHQ